MAKKAGSVSPNQVSSVAEGTLLEGTLRADGDVRINGRIVGTVTAAARVVVASAGVIDGAVVAADADVAGGVQGDLDVAAHLVLRNGARVEGDIRAGKLVIEDGALFNGSCRMVQSETPSGQPYRQSAPRPKRQSRSIQARPEPSRVATPPEASETLPDARKGLGRAAWAVLVIFLVTILAAGAYYGFGGMREEAQDQSGGSARQSLKTDELLVEVPVASADTPADASDLSASETPQAAPSDLSPPIDAARQATGLDRIAMEQARQRILNRRTEPEVAALYQQAEAARQAGMRQYEAGNLDQAAPSFRAARDLYGRMQQAFDEKDHALAQEDPPDTTTVAQADPVEEVSPDSVEEASSDPVEEDPADAVPEEDPEAVLEEVRTVVRRLARQLKRTIEQEDVASMQALYYRGWEPFFGEADAITAVVRPENVRLTGAEAMADVYLDLSYQDDANQPQQRTQAYVWTLMRLDEEWVLRRVSSR